MQSQALFFTFQSDLKFAETSKTVIINEDDEKSRILDLVANLNADMAESIQNETSATERPQFIFKTIEKNNKKLNVYECSEVCKFTSADFQLNY